MRNRERRIYLSDICGRSVNKFVQFVSHCCCGEVAACIVVVESGLTLGMPPFFKRSIDFGNHCFKRFVVSRHDCEGRNKRGTTRGRWCGEGGEEGDLYWLKRGERRG